MPIIRGQHSFDDHFTQIPNAWVRDSRLSFKARGLLAELMSHRTGWSITLKNLAQGKDGRDAVRGAVNELIALGYLTRSDERGHDEKGRLTDYTYQTHDPFQEGADLPTLEKPTLENPHTKKTISKEEQSKELKKNKASRLDPSKLPQSELLAWASENHPRVNAKLEMDCFIDYWTSKGSGATKTDWVATWRNWVRNSEKRLPVSRTQQKQTNLQKNLNLVQLIADKEMGRLEIER